MKEETIQALHPDKNKKNKMISSGKYATVKDAILKHLQKQDLTYTELENMVKSDLKGSFEGNIGWYTVTVKMDRKARNFIIRNNTKPQKYQINKT